MTTNEAAHEQAIQSPYGVGNPTGKWRAVCSCGDTRECDSAHIANIAGLVHHIKIAQEG